MKIIILLLVSLFSQSLYANVIINATRVIFPSDKREVSLKIENSNPYPVLVQTWVDDGDSRMTANVSKTPFTILPPIFRMESKQGQILRIVYNGEKLPDNQESVFWVNVFEVPPKDKNPTNTNSIQLAFRTRIKLFFRPATMKVPSSEFLAGSMSCSLGGGTKKSILRCNNSSGYFISFSKLSLIKNNVKYPVSIESMGMIPPFKSVETKINGITPGSYELLASIINDQGGMIDKKIKVTYE